MRFFYILLILIPSACCTAQQPEPMLPQSELYQETTIPSSFAALDQSDLEIELSRFKKQALQSISLSSGYLYDLGGSGLSGSHVDLSIGSGIPLGSLDNIIGVKPRFRVDWINADSSIDIPTELYQFELQFFYRRPIHDRLSAMAIFSPSIRSDLTTSDNAFRVFALGLLNWECIPNRLTLSGGAVYLGRADLPVLPAIGMTWTPNRRVRLDLRFPVTKLSHRIAKNGGRSEKWTYFSAGLGGNTWAVTRASSTTDELSLRDFRLMVGIEKILNGGGGWFAETGYAFDRRIEYERDDNQVKLGNGLIIQAGWRY